MAIVIGLIVAVWVGYEIGARHEARTLRRAGRLACDNDTGGSHP